MVPQVPEIEVFEDDLGDLFVRRLVVHVERSTLVGVAGLAQFMGKQRQRP